MKLFAAFLFLSTLSLAGCSGPTQVSAREFEERYRQVDQPESMRHVTYLGQCEDRAYIRVSTMSSVNREWSDQAIFVDLNSLDLAFRNQLPDHEYTP